MIVLSISWASARRDIIPNRINCIRKIHIEIKLNLNYTVIDNNYAEFSSSEETAAFCCVSAVSGMWAEVGDKQLKLVSFHYCVCLVVGRLSGGNGKH